MMQRYEIDYSDKMGLYRITQVATGHQRAITQEDIDTSPSDALRQLAKLVKDNPGGYLEFDAK